MLVGKQNQHQQEQQQQQQQQTKFTIVSFWMNPFSFMIFW
jgi:hypothetical protein